MLSQSYRSCLKSFYTLENWVGHDKLVENAVKIEWDLCLIRRRDFCVPYLVFSVYSKNHVPSSTPDFTIPMDLDRFLHQFGPSTFRSNLCHPLIFNLNPLLIWSHSFISHLHYGAVAIGGWLLGKNRFLPTLYQSDFFFGFYLFLGKFVFDFFVSIDLCVEELIRLKLELIPSGTHLILLFCEHFFLSFISFSLITLKFLYSVRFVDVYTLTMFFLLKLMIRWNL